MSNPPEQAPSSVKDASAPEPFDADALLRLTSERPGVYRMYDARGTLIYVGKAARLRDRLSSYFKARLDHPKTRALVERIARVETTVTSNVAEALLLESNLIKEHRPRYNVVLRDDKSYPFIFISTEDTWPRLAYQRGARRRKGQYIGPFPSAAAVKRSMSLVQKLFKVRQCEDSYFRNRTRPCLQHQIDRCTAPCVGLVDEARYRRDVELSIAVLEGRSAEVMESLVQQMESASVELRFEDAARLRDRVAALKQVSDLGGDPGTDADYLAVAARGGQACVQVFFIRQGINLGNRAFYPTIPVGSGEEEILTAFLTQYYLDHELPPQLVLDREIEEAALLERAFSERAERKVRLLYRVRAERARLQALAKQNAEIALSARLASRATQAARLDDLRRVLEREDPPSHIECFDISHTMGEATVAACVVFRVDGASSSEYRRFNIRDIKPGDDYAAMRQALERRFRRLQDEGASLPDLLLIDGGKGQVSVALEVLATLQISDLDVVGVAKGPERRPGEETLLLVRQGREVHLGADSPALLLVQQIRDEAHRFAITGHRKRRGKARQRSSLEDIPGLGPKRRRQLLGHFGGMRALQQASVHDLAAVPGISTALAQKVHDALHPESAPGIGS